LSLSSRFSASAARRCRTTFSAGGRRLGPRPRRRQRGLQTGGLCREGVALRLEGEPLRLLRLLPGRGLRVGDEVEHLGLPPVKLAAAEPLAQDGDLLAEPLVLHREALRGGLGLRSALLEPRALPRRSCEGLRLLHHLSLELPNLRLQQRDCRLSLIGARPCGLGLSPGRGLALVARKDALQAPALLLQERHLAPLPGEKDVEAVCSLPSLRLLRLQGGNLGLEVRQLYLRGRGGKAGRKRGPGFPERGAIT